MGVAKAARRQETGIPVYADVGDERADDAGDVRAEVRDGCGDSDVHDERVPAELPDDHVLAGLDAQVGPAVELDDDEPGCGHERDVERDAHAEIDAERHMR